MTHLKVIIRVRPLSKRESENGCSSAIEIQNGNTVAITNIKVPEGNAGDSRQRVRRFTFDCCFSEDATQDDIFSNVEEVVSRAIKRRYHSCVLAYGQSSTGKTHTMMGFPHDPGLTPRLSEKIFGYLRESAVGNEMDSIKTTISYLEIYNEKVRDLLVRGEVNTKNVQTLRVREHPKKGPYVQGLTEHQVTNAKELLDWVHFGNENRRVASTLSNPHSSRSHSVVTITCDGVKLYLVDLAGSERAASNSSKVSTTSSFREGANINRSLVALGNVISALAEQPVKSKLNRRRFVPYRDSILTWLLKDTLGGNSKTVMIATISPSSGCYSETVNTLRFGQRAKLIVSCPVVNEDPKEKIIRELRTEIARLRELLKETQVHPSVFMPECQASQTNGTFNVHSFISIEDDKSQCSSTLTIETTNPDEISHVTRRSSTEYSLDPSEELTVIQMSTEKLIPVMNVQSNINTEKRQIPKFRRTASVDSVGIMDRSRNSSFGSHESLPTTKPPSVGSKTLPKSSLTQRKLSGTKMLSTSHPLIRRRSVDKPSTLKTLLEKQNIPKKIEKSVETEGTKNTVKPRVDSHRKTVSKPRSNIVANVTKRLYLQAKNKDAGTDTEGIDEPRDEVPKELSICSNARLRLKEITQKALRAHRFKQVETQTETVVLRVKEISTDVKGLRNSLSEVKDVETSTIEKQTVDASVGCSLIENFNSCNNDSMKITKTCAVQCSEHMLTPEADITSTSRREPSPSRVSFTKYLQPRQCSLQPSIECANPGISNPIYANSVNINVSHHYINGKRVGSLSDDSLEDQTSNNMLLPTPDLISNHNSLDPNIHAMQNEQPPVELKVRYALQQTDNESELFVGNFETEPPKQNLLKVYSIANITEKISCIDLPVCSFAPEIHHTVQYQIVSPLHTQETEYSKAVLIDSKDTMCFDTYTIYMPKILMSSIKISPLELKEESLVDSQDRMYDFQEVPDSIEYHKANKIKHVRFSPQKTKNQDGLFKSMSMFLEEATKLMNNITSATKSFENASSSSLPQDFDLQITLNDIDKLERYLHSKKKKSKRVHETDSHENFSQTCVPEIVSQSTQCEDFNIPFNKYDSVLEDSCKKLEYKLNSVNRKISRRNEVQSEDTSAFPSLNSFDPSFSGISDVNEDYSLESNPLSYSDYGSLNRRKNLRRDKQNCSPSALLKQLTHIRKQMIQSSREDLSHTDSKASVSPKTYC